MKTLNKKEHESLLKVADMISKICEQLPEENIFRKRYISLKYIIPIKIISMDNTFDKGKWCFKTRCIKKRGIRKNHYHS